MNISESNLILITQHGPRWMMTSHHVIISYTVALTEFRNHVCTFSAVQSITCSRITCSRITCSQITTLHSFFFKTFLISKTQILLILPSNTLSPHTHSLWSRDVTAVYKDWKPVQWGSVGSMPSRLKVSVQGVRPQRKVQRSRSCRSRMVEAL